MANTHRYGFRFLRNLWGGDVPEVEVLPMASGNQPNTGTPNTNVNLNIGDPVSKLETGAVQLCTPGSGAATTTERCYGIVVGFPQVLIAGAVRPSAFYPGGTVYGSGLAPYTLQTRVAVIPVVGREFEIDTDAAGGSSLDTYEEWQAAVGSVATWKYTPINTTSSNPKANPLLDETTITDADASSLQLRIQGISRLDDKQDFSLANVALRVVFNAVQESPFVTTGGWDGS
jgi:hypothetical protein